MELIKAFEEEEKNLTVKSNINVNSFPIFSHSQKAPIKQACKGMRNSGLVVKQMVMCISVIRGVSSLRKLIKKRGFNKEQTPGSKMTNEAIKFYRF